MKPPIDPELAARLELATPNRYQLVAPQPPPEPWWARALEGVRDVLARLLSHVHVGHGAAMTISTLVLALAAAALLAVVIRVALALKPRKRASRNANLDPALVRNDHRALAGAAFSAADRGETTRAVRLLLRAAVALLDLRGAIDDDASATIGELRGEVRRRGNAFAAPFDDIASAYAAGIYAQRTLSSEDWRRASGAYETLEAWAGA